jgi:hypothetical protein
MPRFTVLLLAGGGLLALAAIGQEPTSQLPQKRVTVVHTRDGGVTEVLQSIDVPPKPGEPFTLTLETEWVKQLYDGGTTTLVNRRKIARDAAGRVYQERCALVPKNQDHGQSIRSMTQIFDPLTHTRHDCFYLEETRTCEVLSYTRATSNIYRPMSPATGPLPGEQGSAIHEDLGKRFIAGVETEGTRDTLIYNPGVYGNDRQMTVENEFWWSSKLGLNLSSIKIDPRVGKQTFAVTDLILGDPDPLLFQLPDGFKIVDRR